MARKYTDEELALTPTPGESEMLPWDRSPLEKQSHGIASLLKRLGYDNYRAHDFADNLTFTSEFIPVLGDVQGFREGKHMIEQGSPKLGAAVMGLSMIPFVPVSRMVKTLRNRGNLSVTPTRAFRTSTGESELEQASDAINDELFRKYGPSYVTKTGQLDKGIQEAATVGRTNVETLLERELVKFASDTASDLNKAYPVENILKQIESKVPAAAKGGFQRQVYEFVPPELMKTKATIQEVLDNIGKNKPTIKEMESQSLERYLDAVGSGSGYSSYLPNIPKSDTPARTLPEAMDNAPILNYTERSFALDSPKYDLIPGSTRGHTEVGTGSLPGWTTEGFDANIKNRIFTTRSALYEQDGKKILVGAEGQSGLYGMGTSSKKALEEMNQVSILDENMLESIIDSGYSDVARYLDNPTMIKYVDHQAATLERMIPANLPRRKDFEESLRASGFSVKEFNDPVKEMQKYIDTETTRILSTARQADIGSRYGSTPSEARDLATEDAYTKYIPKLNKMMRANTFTDPKNAPKFTAPPMLKDWFPLHMKTVLNEGVEKGADVVRFPINDYAVAKQTGEDLLPARARDFTDEVGSLREGQTFTPERNASKVLAKEYKKRTEQGIKRIEGEYGIKLNAQSVQDENLNEFLEIVLTPELKEAFQTLVFNRGGAVYKKPLMPLKY